MKAKRNIVKEYFLPFFIFVFVLISFIAISSINVSADSSGTCGDNLTWSYNSSTYTLTISGTGEMTSHPWGYSSTMKFVIIENGVTNICNNAFEHFNLQDVSIPNSVTNVGDYAFVGCDFENITIPYGVTDIGESAFRGCDKLQSITIPNSVISIGKSAFYECTKLETAIIGNNCTSIGEYAFSYCRALVNVNIPTSLIIIENHTFYQCKCITNIVIPDSVTDIAEHAFSDCIGLSNLTIGNGVRNIARFAFSGCRALANIAIPDSVINISGGSFIGRSLSNISVSENNPVYHSDGNCIIETESKTLIGGCKNSVIPNDGSVTSIGDFAFYYCRELTNIVIPNSIESIGYCAFSGCYELNSLTISGSVKNLGNDAFSNCLNLTNVVIGNGVEAIGSLCFGGCEELTSIIIPNSVINIGVRAFSNCAKLANVTVGNGVSSVGSYAFEDCSLTRVNYNGSIADWCNISFDNALANPLSRAHVLFINDSEITEICESDLQNITSINDYAFYNCSSLSSVSLPNCITSIGNYAFYNGIELNNVIIPNSVINIGNCAFQNCTELTNVIIPNSVIDIGYSAFKGCSNLTTLTVGNGASSIGENAFGDCSNLIEINYNTNYNENVSDIFGGSGVSGTGVKVIFGDNVQEIPSLIFWYPQIKAVVLGNNVTNICQKAFHPYGLLDIYYYGTETQWNSIEISDYNEWIDNATMHYKIEVAQNNATCESLGTTAYSYWSNTDPVEYIVEPIVIPATGHDWYIPSTGLYYLLDKSKNKAPTCTTDGCRRYRCRHKLSEYYDEVIPATGHSFTYYETVQYASCTQDEVKTALCDNGCGTYNTITVEGSALGHSFTNYVYNYDATYESDGTQTAKCDRCSATDTIIANGSKRINRLKDVIIMANNSTVFYNSSPTITVTANNVPNDYYLIVFDGNSFVAKGDNKSVTFSLNEITEGKTLTVKVVDQYGNTGNGANCKKDITITVRQSFITRLIELLQKLFSVFKKLKLA